MVIAMFVMLVHVLVLVLVRVHVLVHVRVSVTLPPCMRSLAVPIVDTNRHIDRSKPMLDDTRHLEAVLTKPDPIEDLLDHHPRHPEIEQRPQHHVAGRTRRSIEVEVQAAQRRPLTHRRPRSPAG